MAIDGDTYTQDMLSNPTKLVKATIDALEASDTGGSFTITDPNNGFVMTQIANMEIFAKFSQKIDSVTSYLYPQRARNADQLYPHLSEYDYVKLMASPATLPFVFALSEDWIIANSVYYDTNYNKLIIPATSYITMGNIVYSMYYPIEILVNRNTKAVTAFYDTSVSNDLYTLSSNMLLDVQRYTQNGINWFQITFNMFQFERTVFSDTVSSNQGYIKTVSYEDQFYAAKVFTTDKKGNYVELSYALTKLFYDYQTPTVLLSLLSDTNQIRFEIPQIYFDNGQISQTIRVELYTTKGAVNYSLSLADVTGRQAYFDPTSSPYAAPMDQMPSYILYPTVLDVVGGSNALTYSEVRDAIVGQRLSTRTAVTTPEVIEAGKKAGFNLTRIVDDLTERIYFASNILTDSKGMILPTFAGNILLADDALAGNPSTILSFTDGYYTVLPTTTFTISANGVTAIPLNDGQVSAYAGLTQTNLIAELNKGTYVRQPFHISLRTDKKSPQAMVYNLLSPSMTSLVFNAENAHSAPQLAVTACGVNHLVNGTGGYQIVLNMTRSSNLQGIPASNLSVILTCLTKTGSFAYLPATYVSTSNNGVDTWVVQLSTSYHITNDDYLTVSMRNASDVLTSVEISLTQSFTVLGCFTRVYDPTIPVDGTLNLLLPSSLQSTLVVMAQQTLTLSLGTNLSSQIYSGVNTSWGNDVYKITDDTVYYSTDVPVFQNNEQGVIETRINPTNHNVETIVIYPQGSIPSTLDDLVVTTVLAATLSSQGTPTVLTVDTTIGLLPGMAIRGLNLAVGTIITAVTNNTITLSKPITASVAKGIHLTVTNPSVTLRTAAPQPNAGTQIVVESTAGLIPGLSVFGFDIPAGDTIQSVDSLTQITLTNGTLNPLATNTLLSFINTTAPGVVKIAKGSIVNDPTGKPIIVKDAQNQYLIPTILFDGRLFSSQDPSDQQVIASIPQYLQNYANQISTLDAGLLETAAVYYKPARTMGYANFGIGGGKTLSMSLELSFSFTVYVDVLIYNSQTLLSTMEDSINTIVNAAVQNPLISVSDITETIRENLGSNISAVEGGFISGVDGLRLIALEEAGAVPSVEHILVQQADGSVLRKPNITISFLPTPDTSSTAQLISL
jgi:hypothetical protein